MDRELSEGVSISVTLGAISVLMGIIFSMVYLGNDIKESAGDALTGVKSDLSVGFVRALTTGEADNEMPAATAYNIMKTHEGVILESACGKTGLTTNIMLEYPCLKDNLEGRVLLEVAEVNGDSFIAFVHQDTCNWRVGTCTCKDKSGYTELKSKYNIVTSW